MITESFRDSRRPAVLQRFLALAAVFVVAAHLLLITHSGHVAGGDAAVYDVAVEAPVPAVVAAAVGGGAGPGVQAQVFEFDGASVVESDHRHDEPVCGDVTQSRASVPVSALLPTLVVLWFVPPLVEWIQPDELNPIPRRMPHLVRELRVQRV